MHQSANGCITTRPVIAVQQEQPEVTGRLMAQDAASSASHNFPINLAIKPLDLGEDAVENDEQGKWITEYGIAGRVW